MFALPIALALTAIAGGNDPIPLPPISPDPLAPRTLVWPVLHEGDPAPGIPGATISAPSTPAIDGQGNILVSATYLPQSGPSGVALWYGPPGDMSVVARTNTQAPDMPDGVTILVFAPGQPRTVSENGWINFGAFLTGPGIVSGVNANAVFSGPAGDIRKVLQSGDPAPGFGPGVVIHVDASTGFQMSTAISDTARQVLIVTWVSGPGITSDNNEVVFIGPPHGQLAVIWREGMDAPGANGGRFRSFDSMVFNDAGQIAFRGQLINEGPVNPSNDGGQWFGGVGTLQKIFRQGDQAMFLPDGVHIGGGNAPAINGLGETAIQAGLGGPDVTPQNDAAHWLGDPELTVLVDREGDPVGDELPGVVFASVATSRALSAWQRYFYGARYVGPGINATNEYALYLGHWAEATESLRDGNPAPAMEFGVKLGSVGCGASHRAANDEGDFLTVTDIDGPGVTVADKVIVWLHDSLRNAWLPLLRSAVKIDGRVVSLDSACSSIGAYYSQTGGSDGKSQSFNDDGQLAVNLEFADGSEGIYLLQFRWPGDGDGDGDVDFADFAAFQRCAGDVITGQSADCEPFDFDLDNDVDMNDYNYFHGLVTGARGAP